MKPQVFKEMRLENTDQTARKLNPNQNPYLKIIFAIVPIPSQLHPRL